MKKSMKNLCLASVAGALLGVAVTAHAATVTVDPSAAWIGYMNVWDIPQNTGAYQFGSVWGTADLTATWAGPVLTLGTNNINDPNPYWYTPSGGPGAIGNKIMDANMYVQEPDGTFTGQTLTFKGTVTANTLFGKVDGLGNSWTSVAFIKEFVADYSSFTQVTVPLNVGGFSISMPLSGDPTRHVQYGFETIGPCVWITDAAAFGDIKVTAAGTSVSVSGTLDLGAGWSGTFSAPGSFAIELRNGATVVESTTASVAADGTYAFTTAQQGTFDIVFKGPHWLSRIKTGVVIGSGGATGVNTNVVNGDVDGDDVVSVFDYIELSDAFDSDPSSGTWNPDADLDHDGVVSVFDYIILSDNFDKSGDLLN